MRAFTALGLSAALLVGCGATSQGLPHWAQSRFYTHGATAEFAMERLGTSGSLGFEDLPSRRWVAARYVIDEANVRLDVEQSSNVAIDLTVGFDESGVARAGFGGVLDVDAVFRRRSDGDVDAEFRVVID